MKLLEAAQQQAQMLRFTRRICSVQPDDQKVSHPSHDAMSTCIMGHRMHCMHAPENLFAYGLELVRLWLPQTGS